MDGYPKKYEDTSELFMVLPPVEEDQEPDENAQKIIEPKLIPNKLVILAMSDEEILERLQSLPEDKVKGTHFDAESTKRRLKLFRKLMDSSTGEFTLSDFFKENKVDIHQVNVSAQTMNLLESIIKPMPIREEEERQLIKQRMAEESERRRKAREEMDKKQTIIRDIQQEDYMMKKENEQNEEREALDQSSRALRRYLDANLVPILS